MHFVGLWLEVPRNMDKSHTSYILTFSQVTRRNHIIQHMFQLLQQENKWRWIEYEFFIVSHNRYICLFYYKNWDNVENIHFRFGWKIVTYNWNDTYKLFLVWMDVLNCTLKQNNIFLIDLFLHSFFFNLSHWLSLCWLNECVEEALNLHCIPHIFHLHLQIKKLKKKKVWMHLKARTSFLLSDTENPMLISQKLLSFQLKEFLLL